MPTPTCPDLDTLLHMGLPLSEELLLAAAARPETPPCDKLATH